MGTECETTEVLICGCGPTGALLSAYLGRSGIHNVVLEKEADITTDPRGISLDEDGIRIVQGLGLYEHVFTDIGTGKYRNKYTDKTSLRDRNLIPDKQKCHGFDSLEVFTVT
jgi:2-polyprenyl-6-methoxyphenol hydroxylase-like FAD-dependent oxidoreductase